MTIERKRRAEDAPFGSSWQKKKPWKNKTRRSKPARPRRLPVAQIGSRVVSIAP
jgi:hypothetical protein